ncbi:hypothetical protein ASZ78_014907 [Callipepla squamata]|uniref:N-acetylaspartate synthetase n=1 Tax=Callipepla squamata TaxID=9009 RepID=A0A226MX24_CALSU|nr:hypothetical protein ASZ78_014907 [Callipepla squamata]
MHCLSPKMVCETKIVAEDHDSIPGAKKDTIIVSSSQMWPTLSGSPSSPPAPLGTPKEEAKRDSVYIREFHPSEQEVVRRIFYEGIMERIPNTAFRGLKQQPLTQLLYALLAVMCFVVTKSFLLTCCLPIFLMGMRYYFSRKVILHYLDCALHTDMSDIEQYYMKPPDWVQRASQSNGHARQSLGLVKAKLLEEAALRAMSGDVRQKGQASRGNVVGVPRIKNPESRFGQHDLKRLWMSAPMGDEGTQKMEAGSCFWVAVLDGNVVGIVAARGNEEDNTVELRRMSVDSNYRGKGIAKALGRKVLEFAMLNNYSSVVLGTTAVKMAAHKLYESLGFKHVGVVEHYALPGMTHSLLERMFFQLRYHRYRLQLREE